MQSRNVVGVAIAGTIGLACAGATVYFLTRPSDTDLLLSRAKNELATGHYALAAKSLEQVAAAKRNDPAVYLALARAYVGIDQVDKARAAIAQAQQLGAGIVSDPSLASELAEYYSRQNNHQRAIELLRPLADAGIPGKKAQLADLDALYGDELLQENKPEQAMKCWEEVQSLNEGTRCAEAPSRLNTIYQRCADVLMAQGRCADAIPVLNKATALTPTPENYARAADAYERSGNLETALEELRKANELKGANPEFNAMLADLMVRRGKELMDKGDTGRGYGYLQQAQSLNPSLAAPQVVLRNIKINMNGRCPGVSGEVWNAGNESLGRLDLRIQLVAGQAAGAQDTGKMVLAQTSRKVVDQFDQSLPPQGFKTFTFEPGIAAKKDGSASFDVYLNGELYKSYPIGQTPSGQQPSTASAAPTIFKPRPVVQAPGAVPDGSLPAASMPASSAEQSEPTGLRPYSPLPSEDQTLRDLER